MVKLFYNGYFQGVKDYGDITYTQDNTPAIKNMKNLSDFMGCNKAIIRKIPEILRENQQYLLIGGDHSIGFGSIAGHMNHDPNLAVIWVDAHADLNLNVTSPSGNTHGMPVSLFLQELRKHWKDFDFSQFAPHCLPCKQLVYIGLRDIDPYETYLMNKLGIKQFAMDSIDKLGINRVMEQALDHIDPKRNIHVSFDIDALDVAVAPSTGTAVAGGLTLREGLYIMDTIRDTDRLQGVDMVEVNPHIGNEADVQATVSAALNVIKVAFGHKRGGCHAKIDESLLA